ncbi:hypothetical protein TOTORO_00710 [Serratia phage vB_SmaS-Totoro]|nr:hypothetical protein TOTORO_00710 [Serratia phage vB_SmaS-Totoro]
MQQNTAAQAVEIVESDKESLVTVTSCSQSYGIVDGLMTILANPQH